MPYDQEVRITFDPAERAWTLENRGLDFLRAGAVIIQPTARFIDERRDYGECREMCYGMLDGRLVMVGYTRRGSAFHVFTMRKANAREQDDYGPAKDR
jgi:uncharacterized protein